MPVTSDNKPRFKKVRHVAEIGGIVREKRKGEKLTQSQLASLSAVGNRFLSELENGKQTIELGRALRVLHKVGLEIYIGPSSWQVGESL